MQGDNALLNVLTIPPGASVNSPRMVIDGVRGAIFEYGVGGQFVGSWASSAGTDPYGNQYPEGFNGSMGVIAGTTFLVYAGPPGAGNLIGSWAGVAGTDIYGNQYPQGLYAIQGSLQGIQLSGGEVLSTTIVDSVVNNATINQPGITGGTMIETSIVLDTGGGNILLYTTTTTTLNYTTPGQVNWTAPVSGTAVVRCWGADAGAGGGSGARGGEGGGAGEYAGEGSYPITAGQVYPITIGGGGTGGVTGHGGGNGGDTIFDNGGVFANGGNAGGGFVGGVGGGQPGNGPSTNTWHYPGGNGGGDGTQSTGGCGGGGRAGSSGPGGNGSKSTSSAGASGGAAGAGLYGIAGGNGGAAAANGNAGGGGGGCGAATSAATGTSSYRLSNSATYFGSDGSNPNAWRSDVGGNMYQGGETASGGSYNGTMKSLGIISGNPQSDLAGKTIDSVGIRLEWLHTWYNNGAYVILGYTNKTSTPLSWDGSGITAVHTWWQGNVGSPVSIDLTGMGLGSALQSGACKSICLGPGAAYDLYNYGYMYGAGGDNNQNPLINVNWHTGSQPVTAGNGANGRVQLIYTNTSTLAAALSPVAGTDGSNNAFALGYTGPVQAFQPNVTPSVVEGWHALTPPSGLTGSCRVKVIAEANCMLLDMSIQWSSGAANTWTFPNLPYAASGPGGLARIYTQAGNATLSAVGQLPRVYISGTGLQFISPATTGGGSFSCTLVLPIN